MQIETHAQHIDLTKKVEELIERRLGFALDRFEDKLDRITVHLTDENGPKGGVCKRCRMVVHTNAHGMVVVEDTEDAIEAAICKTADSLRRALRRRFEKSRDRSCAA